jgi:hypothetical protein
MAGILASCNLPTLSGHRKRVFYSKWWFGFAPIHSQIPFHVCWVIILTSACAI